MIHASQTLAHRLRNEGRQEGLNLRQKGPLRPSLAALPPPPECARIDRQEARRGGLREPPGGPDDYELFGQGRAGGPWIEAEQGDDGWQKPQGRGRSVEFPIRDGRLVHAESLGDLALEEAQVDPPLA